MPRRNPPTAQLLPVTLSPQDIERLNRAERILHDLLPLFDVADSCGVACETLRAQAAEMREQIANIRQAFGVLPNQ